MFSIYVIYISLNDYFTAASNILLPNSGKNKFNVKSLLTLVFSFCDIVVNMSVWEQELCHIWDGDVIAPIHNF